MRLFLERARAVRPDLAHSPCATEAVAEICRRLDGLPLAIELAAAWSTVFLPPALLARLDRRLPQLMRGPRDVPAWHQTMRDAIAWSYDMLSPAEQAVFRRLSVFIGGCTVDAAAVVCADPDVVHVIESLVRQSLLQVIDSDSDGGGEPRFVMLETVREFAADQLAADEDEEQAVRRRHAADFLALTARAEPTYWADAAGDRKAEMERELGNLRAVLAWAIAHDEVDTAHGLASTMFDPHWMTGDNAREQEAWTPRALALPGSAPAHRVKALTNAAWLAQVTYDSAEARTLAEEALALVGSCGDTFGLAWA